MEVEERVRQVSQTVALQVLPELRHIQRRTQSIMVWQMIAAGLITCVLVTALVILWVVMPHD